MGYKSRVGGLSKRYQYVRLDVINTFVLNYKHVVKRKAFRSIKQSMRLNKRMGLRKMLFGIQSMYGNQHTLIQPLLSSKHFLDTDTHIDDDPEKISMLQTYLISHMPYVFDLTIESPSSTKAIQDSEYKARESRLANMLFLPNDPVKVYMSSSHISR